MEKSPDQYRFPAEVKEGEVLIIHRTPGDAYKVSIVNQNGFEIAKIPEGTEVVLGKGGMVGPGGIVILGHDEIPGKIEYFKGQPVVDSEMGKLKFWDNDSIKIIKVAENK